MRVKVWCVYCVMFSKLSSIYYQQMSYQQMSNRQVVTACRHIPTFGELHISQMKYDTQMKCTLWTVNDVTMKDSLERPQGIFTASEGSFHMKDASE